MTTSFCSEMSNFPHDTVQTLVMSKINTSMSPEELFITELCDLGKQYTCLIFYIYVQCFLHYLIFFVEIFVGRFLLLLF